MTNKLLTLTFLIIANIAIGRSQVTIGNTEKPIEGSLLQLKDIDKVPDGSKNASKGIMLPRVQLTTPTELYPMFDLGDVNYTTVQKEIHTGLLVYVPELWNDNYCPGIYIWDGKEWKGLHSEIVSTNINNKVVFIGNSITQLWASSHPLFFSENNYINQGIGGNTTSQCLARFQQDVIEYNPLIVVINGGINDIAANIDPEDTFTCIKKMAELAKTNNLKVILTSILPAGYIPWNHSIINVPLKVESLNAKIKNYADNNGCEYVDYYSEMVDSNKAMIAEYTTDGVHVSSNGYNIMEPIITNKIKQLQKVCISK